MALTNKLSAIGNAIREKTGKTDLLTLDQMPEEIKGIETGSADDYYDTFWDNFQQNGERTSYDKAFYGAWWNNDIFKPKYDLIIKGSGTTTFQSSSITGDFSQLLKDCNVILDTSECTNMTAFFQYCYVTKVPTISLAKTSNASSLFYGDTSLETIEKLIVHSNVTFSATFNICNALKNITIEGEIGKNISFAQSSMLSDESVQSIINALIDLTGQTTQTLSLHKNIKAKLTETQIASITSKNWTLA